MPSHDDIVKAVSETNNIISNINITTITDNELGSQYKLNISYTDLEKSVGKTNEITEVQSDMALLIYDKDNIQVLLELNNSSENELRTRTLAIRTENPAH